MNLKPAWILYKYLHLMQYDIHKAMMHHKLKRISPIIEGRWLDIGAGDQPYKQYFARAMEYLTTNTKKHYSEAEFKLLEKQTTYWIEDGKMLPVPDNSMDGVACFQVLSVINSPGEFFREVNRILKTGGKLVLTTDFLYPSWSEEDRYHHTAFSLRQLALSNGFINASTESFGGFGSTMYSLFMRYMRSFPGLWKNKNILAKTVSAILYLILLLLLPFVSLAGLIIFHIEKNSTQNLIFTFNTLLTAEKSGLQIDQKVST